MRNSFRNSWCIGYFYLSQNGQFNLSKNGSFRLSLTRRLFYGERDYAPRWKAIRRNEVRYMDITFTDTLQLSGIKGRRMDMELDICPVDDSNVYQKFEMRFAQDAYYYTAVSFHPNDSILKIDRKFSGSRRAVIHQRRSLVKHQNGRIRMSEQEEKRK